MKGLYSKLKSRKLKKMADDYDLDGIIQRLWASRDNPKNKKVLHKNELKFLCVNALDVFKSQPVFLELIPPITICGDVHGQFFDLLRLFEAGGSPDIKNYLFLGDYVDRGEYSINTISLLFAYKIKYPNNFFLLRGNHESAPTNRDYGFKDECCELYSASVWTLFNEVFEWMPITALINGRILCIHGGISPDLNSLSDLKAIPRPTDVPETGLLCDLLWSDPEASCEEWGPNDRQTSYVFGQKPLKKLLTKLSLDLIIRAHQAVGSGYEFPFTPNHSIVTLFSAPNYGGMGNKGALMHISKKMVCTFTIIDPCPLDKMTTKRPKSSPKK